MTQIKAKKDLYNAGKCFTKGKVYTTEKICRVNASLMEARVKNDQGEPHILGSWWRNFEIID